MLSPNAPSFAPSYATDFKPNQSNSLHNISPKLPVTKHQGTIAVKYHTRAVLIGNHITSWLLALRPSDFVSITVFGSIIDNWMGIVSKLWNNKFNIVSTVPNSTNVDLIICDGDCQPTPPLNSLPTIVIDSICAELMLLSHRLFGGITDFKSLIQLLNIPVKPFEPQVQQPLASIIDYKIYVSPKTESSDGLNIWTDVLSYSKPKQKVLLPCGFGKRSKQGARYLQPHELLCAWDIPRHLLSTNIRNNRLLRGLIPGKFLLGIFDHVIKLINVEKQPIRVKSLPPLEAKPLDDRGTYLPEINSWLSRKWINTSLITKHSKKADNAAIPTHLWDIRICEPLGVQHDSQQTRMDCLSHPSSIRAFMVALQRHYFV